MSTRLHDLLAEQAREDRPRNVPPVGRLVELRRSRRRRRAAVAGAVLACAVVGVGDAALSPGSNTTAVLGQAHKPPRQSLTAPAGDIGTPGYLPAGWRLYAESDQPLPTGGSARTRSVERRYRAAGDGFLLLMVTYGDVGPLTAGPGATTVPGLRPGTSVLVTPPQGSFDAQYAWAGNDRVHVQASFLRTGLSAEEQHKVVVSVR